MGATGDGPPRPDGRPDGGWPAPGRPAPGLVRRLGPAGARTAAPTAHARPRGTGREVRRRRPIWRRRAGGLRRGASRAAARERTPHRRAGPPGGGQRRRGGARVRVVPGDAGPRDRRRTDAADVPTDRQPPGATPDRGRTVVT